MVDLCLIARSIPCVCAAKAYFDILFYCYKWEEGGGFHWDTFSSVLSVCYVDNSCLKVVGFQSLVVHCFLLPQIIAGVVCHQMGCKSIKLDSSFLPKWKTKLIKVGLI